MSRYPSTGVGAVSGARGEITIADGRLIISYGKPDAHPAADKETAALLATGKVKAAHKKRRRRKEFLDFMDEVVAAYPKRRLEVILDNLNTHKKNDAWLARHPLVKFHYTPTRASWLNQVEGWFSILQGQSLTGASFSSVEQIKGKRSNHPTWTGSQARPAA